MQSWPKETADVMPRTFATRQCPYHRLTAHCV